MQRVCGVFKVHGGCMVGAKGCRMEVEIRMGCVQIGWKGDGDEMGWA